MASSVDMCAGVCAARCESSARGSIVGGRRAAATAARGTDGRRSPTLHLALGLLGPLFHGLDFLLVRDDLVVVFRMTLAKLLELRFPLIKHLLALLEESARLGELRLEVRDLLLGRGALRLKILDLPLGRGRAGLGRVLLRRDGGFVELRLAQLRRSGARGCLSRGARACGARSGAWRSRCFLMRLSVRFGVAFTTCFAASASQSSLVGRANQLSEIISRNQFHWCRARGELETNCGRRIDTTCRRRGRRAA